MTADALASAPAATAPAGDGVAAVLERIHLRQGALT